MAWRALLRSFSNQAPRWQQHPRRSLSNQPSILPNILLARTGFYRRIEASHLLTSHLGLSRRSISSDVFVNILYPPAVFVGLLFTLWFYKCCMMVLFQNKIIYMPSVPPFSRREKVSDYASSCQPIIWREKAISSLDGTKLNLCIGSTYPASEQRPKVVVLYFQGNASSIPPRLPALSSVMKRANSTGVDCTLVALSYRGFWTSGGRASQSGIEKDAAAALQWVQGHSEGFQQAPTLIIWGQSIGAGVATRLMCTSALEKEGPIKVNALILETPFTSIRDMLVALYPQKWLPYRYLHPLLWNHWDSVSALRTLKSSRPDMKILFVTAEKDEVVPRCQSDKLVELCQSLGFETNHEPVRGAYHTNAVIKPGGQIAVSKFLHDVSLRQTYSTAHSRRETPKT